MFRELQKKNKALSGEECITLLKEQTRGVLSVLGDGGYPYGMPMNHFYNADDGMLYFHCGPAGHRLDALARCSKVSFCTYDRGWREEGDWAWNVKSVIVFGTMEVLEDMELIRDITARLSRKFILDEAYIQKEIDLYGHETKLLRLKPEHICGKLVKEA